MGIIFFCRVRSSFCYRGCFLSHNLRHYYFIHSYLRKGFCSVHQMSSLTTISRKHLAQTVARLVYSFALLHGRNNRIYCTMTPANCRVFGAITARRCFSLILSIVAAQSLISKIILYWVLPRKIERSWFKALSTSATNVFASKFKHSAQFCKKFDYVSSCLLPRRFRIKTQNLNIRGTQKWEKPTRTLWLENKICSFDTLWYSNLQLQFYDMEFAP
jgi:hypothetical protein